MRRDLFKLLTLGMGLCLTLAACSNYVVSVNENIVYEPPKLFSDYKITDGALKECVRETIEEEKITKAGQLVTLACPPGQIKDLTGLRSFPDLGAINLSNNKVRDVGELVYLPKLKQLDLENNDIADFSELKSLEGLVFLNIKGNQSLSCTRIERIFYEVSDQLTLIC